MKLCCTKFTQDFQPRRFIAQQVSRIYNPVSLLYNKMAGLKSLPAVRQGSGGMGNNMVENYLTQSPWKETPLGAEIENPALSIRWVFLFEKSWSVFFRRNFFS